MVTIVCDGNSITFGTGYGPGLTYPQDLQTLFPWAQKGSSCVIYNVGVNSQTTHDMIADAASQLDPLIDPAGENILVAWEIGNDLGTTGSETPRLAVNVFWQYCDARRAAGWKVIAVNVLHRAFSLYAAYTQEEEDARNALYDECNALLAAEWHDHADDFVDILSDSRLYNPHDLTVYYEGVHPNGIGRQYCAQDINPAIIRVYNKIHPNIFANRANIVVPKTSISFTNANINTQNTLVIYELGASIKSFKPERSFNAVTGFTQDVGYYFVAKTDIDLSAVVAPPVL